MDEIRDWHVVGRSKVDKLLLVECQRTGLLGTVKDFTPEQWERAGSAHFNAFRWFPKWGEVLEMTATVA